MDRQLRFIFLNERGLRAGWRLAIFLVIWGILSSAVFLSLRWVGMRPGAPERLTSSVVTLTDGATLLVLLLATWIMSRIEQRPMGVYGLPLEQQPVLSRLATGYIFWGFLPLSICLLTLHFLGGFHFGGLALHGAQIWLSGLKWFVAFLLVGLTEEYLLRGYALYTLADGIGFWPATIVLGVLFGLGHAANPGETRIGVIATVAFALFASVTLRMTGNLWLAVGAHAGWDWGQSFFYGVSDSGLVAEGHLLNSHVPTTAPVWLTGGSVGPEGSVVTLILWSAMMLLFYLIYRKRKQPLLAIEPGTAPPWGSGIITP